MQARNTPNVVSTRDRSPARLRKRAFTIWSAAPGTATAALPRLPKPSLLVLNRLFAARSAHYPAIAISTPKSIGPPVTHGATLPPPPPLHHRKRPLPHGPRTARERSPLRKGNARFQRAGLGILPRPFSPAGRAPLHGNTTPLMKASPRNHQKTAAIRPPPPPVPLEPNPKTAHSFPPR